MSFVNPIDLDLSSVDISIGSPIDVNGSPILLLFTDSSTVIFVAISVPDKSAALFLDLDTGILLFPKSVKVDVSLLVFSF